MESASPISPEFQVNQWYPKEPGYHPSLSPIADENNTIREVLKQFKNIRIYYKFNI